MAISLYDTAVLNKIKNWVKDPNMTITSPNETNRLFSYVADTNNDKPIELPLIALRRETEVQLLNSNKVPLTHNGQIYQADASFVDDSDYKNKSILLNAIPIKLSYQIDIYTRYQEEADEYLRNFVFNIVNYPKLQVTIPYNDINVDHNSNMRLVPTLTDNSDIPERLFPGQFSRWTIKFFIDDAYLWSIPVKDNYTFENLPQVEVMNWIIVYNISNRQVKENLDG